MMETIAGIDPGKEGGIATVSQQRLVWATPMPMSGKEVDGHAIAEILHAQRPSLVVIEKAQAMPKQGGVSMFRYGDGYGLIKGVCEGLGLPYVLVTPQAWKKRILAGTAKDKEAAINYVRRSWPSVDLTPGAKRKPHDGMADAICMAEYGWREWRAAA